MGEESGKMTQNNPVDKILEKSLTNVI